MVAGISATLTAAAVISAHHWCLETHSTRNTYGHEFHNTYVQTLITEAAKPMKHAWNQQNAPTAVSYAAQRQVCNQYHDGA
jgi:hypothetical protein